jgi:hypothetical protein
MEELPAGPARFDAKGSIRNPEKRADYIHRSRDPATDEEAKFLRIFCDC